VQHESNMRGCLGNYKVENRFNGGASRSTDQDSNDDPGFHGQSNTRHENPFTHLDITCSFSKGTLVLQSYIH